jgi:hypothetical protein
MVAEVFAGIASLKAAFDIAKTVKDIDDASRRNATIMELQEKILLAQAAQSQLLEENADSRRRLRELECWESEKARYELREISPGMLCYMLKEEFGSQEPEHRLCANCFSAGRKSFLQQHIKRDYYDKFKCHSCDEVLSLHKGSPPDMRFEGDPGFSRSVKRDLWES